MKKILMILFASVISLSAFAQQATDYAEIVRSAISTEKKALIADVMQFSDQEGQVFWPLYNEYQNKLYAIGTKKYQLILKFADHFDNMAEEEAKNILMEANDIDAEYLKLKKTYIKKFLKVLPAQTVLRYFQAENKIKLLIDAKISSEIPLLNNL